MLGYLSVSPRFLLSLSCLHIPHSSWGLALPASLLPLGMALPTQTRSSHSTSSREEFISEILDRIISSPSHAFLSGKITQPTQPPMCTDMLPQPLFPHQPAKSSRLRHGKRRGS